METAQTEAEGEKGELQVEEREWRGHCGSQERGELWEERFGMPHTAEKTNEKGRAEDFTLNCMRWVSCRLWREFEEFV